MAQPLARMGEKPVRHFNPYRTAKSSKARQLVMYALRELLAAEADSGTRRRSRKRRDQETLEATLAAVLLDLVHLALSAAPHAPSRLTITRSHCVLGRFSSRYRAAAFNKKLPELLDQLETLGVIRQLKGDRSGFSQVFTDKQDEKRARQRTTIWPGPRLLRDIERFGITFADLQEAGGEVLILKGARTDYWSPALPTHYDETDDTRRLRRDVDRINRWLAGADITLSEKVPGELAHVDTSDRYLRRQFTRRSFQSGGRLAGGFWTNMERHLRVSRLRINGERVASLDFSSLNPRLLYAMEGVEAPAGDLYTIPGLEAYRRGLKRLFNALLFDEKERRAKLKRTPEEIGAGVVLFPPDWSINQLIAALTEAHQPIAHYFGSGIGHKLQFHESTILVAALLRLKRAGITALPVHDCVIVPRSKKSEAMMIMEEVTREVVGSIIPITVEEED